MCLFKKIKIANKIWIRILILAVILIFFSIPTSAFEIEIGAEERAISDQILLGEIAEISNFYGSEKALNELKGLELGRSPQPGYEKKLTRVLVELSVKSLGYSSSQFNLKMPKKITVKRSSQIISAADLKKLAEENTASYFGSRGLVINYQQELKDIEIAAGDYQIKTAENYQPKLGRNNLALQVQLDGKIVKRIYIPVEIGLRTEVLTAQKDLSYGTKISRSDFKESEKLIFADPEEIIREWNSSLLNNKELRRSLREGSILKESDIKSPFLVKWGDSLRLRVKVNNITINTFVTARERGKLGELITVENESSGKRFQAEVVSTTEVRIVSQ